MWWEFLIYFGSPAFVLWLLQRRNTGFLFRWMGVAGASALFGTTILLSFPEVTLGVATPWYKSTGAVYATWFVFMILGMVARGLNRAIEIRTGEIAKLKTEGVSFKKPALELDFLEFSRPLLFSVMTFSALLSQMTSNSLTVESLAISFQSGFFWQTLLARKDAL